MSHSSVRESYSFILSGSSRGRRGECVDETERVVEEARVDIPERMPALAFLRDRVN